MRVKRVVMLMVPLAAALSVAAVPAHAKRRGGPCRQEIAKLCPNIKPGAGAFRDCLEQHAAELSPACQEHLKQMKAKAEAWQQACKDDVQKLCAQVEPGRGNIRKCLRQHRHELSQTCRDQIARHRRGKGRRSQAPAPGKTPSGQ